MPETELTPVPPGLDPAEAVCLVANYVVAYQVLHRAAQVAPGERVLIHGAAGGIGTALLQLGKLAELEMYGTASTGKQELVANLGATPIDYKKEDFVERIFELDGRWGRCGLRFDRRELCAALLQDVAPGRTIGRFRRRLLCR